LSPYHHPAVCYIKNDNVEVPVFNYDAVINPMPAYRSDKLKQVEIEIQNEFAATD
jgi:hypothetical protein